MAKNCTFGRVGTISLVVHNTITPSAEEWGGWVADLAEFKQTKLTGVLVYTEGGSPNAIQRKQMRDLFEADKTEPPPMAILTTSTVARMAISAFNLFLQNKLRAVEPNRPAEALNYLNPPSDIRPLLLPALRRLCLSIGVSTPISYAESV